ncbi:hypothetical protein QBC43DRAFT_271631 [Cladorrhinum sp. PSN259]|nr:hypothetical protein QBC43DRAFT_271631 [Cladorrhinum sp. PSN259]
MPRQSARPKTDAVRKRKKHTKSRRGCQNCKLRHVKCDESKPSCKTCTSFGVTCAYDSLSSTLQAVSEGMFLVDFTIANFREGISLNNQVLSLLNDNSSPAVNFKSSDLQILSRFHDRTVLTLRTTQISALYQRESVRLAIQNPFLFHLVLTTTLMHDRLTLTYPQSKPTCAEIRHLAAGSAEFNKLLSVPASSLTGPQKDAIFIGAILLACTSFAQIDAEVPFTQIWPFLSSDNDLNWLKFFTGKRAIHDLVDLSRPDSTLKGVARTNLVDIPNAGGDAAAGIDLEYDRAQMRNLPKALIKLLGLDFEGCAAPRPETNRYYVAAVFIGRMVPLALASSGDDDFSQSAQNLLVCLVLIGHLPERFIQMLEEKDPKALLLLAYFYAKIAQSGRWWLWMRATVEGMAIIKYLEMYHGGDIWGLEKLLEYPKRWCCLKVRVDGDDRGL